MTVLEWVVLWPQKITDAFMGAEDPLQIERGRAPGDFSLPSKEQANVLRDGFGNNFLYGAHPTAPGYRYGPPDGTQPGSRRPPRRSEAGGVAGEPRASHENAAPDGWGYAPTEYGGDTEYRGDGYDQER